MAGWTRPERVSISTTSSREALNKISARILETLYAELRRCRVRCTGPFVEHKKTGDHDCVAAKCRPHECKPMAASTVRQIHSIISGALTVAVRWYWIASNPARIAQRPRLKPPQPDPPSAEEAARLVEVVVAIAVVVVDAPLVTMWGAG
jgi:integrase